MPALRQAAAGGGPAFPVSPRRFALRTRGSKAIEYGFFTNRIAKVRHLLVEIHDNRLPEIVPKMADVRRLIRERGLANVDLGWV